MSHDNNCYTPWPDMGQAMRVYSQHGPSPTIAMHAVLITQEVGMNEHAIHVTPIQDGREIDKKQNGFGIGEEGDPMYTLDTTGAQSVFYEIPDTPYLIDAQRVGDFRVYEGNAPSLCARMGTGGNNVPVLVMEIPSDNDE